MAAWERTDSEHRVAAAIEACLTTVLDNDLPLKLRLIHNRPPFLSCRVALMPTACAMSTTFFTSSPHCCRRTSWRA